MICWQHWSLDYSTFTCWCFLDHQMRIVYGFFSRAYTTPASYSGFFHNGCMGYKHLTYGLIQCGSWCWLFGPPCHTLCKHANISCLSLGSSCFHFGSSEPPPACPVPRNQMSHWGLFLSHWLRFHCFYHMFLAPMLCSWRWTALHLFF